MKHYPSITKEIRNDIPIIGFAKIDGSNIRAEWNDKRGFYKFGTRHELIDDKTRPFGRSIPLLRDKYEIDLTRVFKERGWKNVICFFEYWGAESFAGNHNFDQAMDITLIDVNPFDTNPYQMGILPPENFIELFEYIDIPTICYRGYVTTELFDRVKQSTLPGMSAEGVVCKGNDNGKTVMFKIKSQAWLDKLKEYCNDNESLFQRLC